MSVDIYRKELIRRLLMSPTSILWMSIPIDLRCIDVHWRPMTYVSRLNGPTSIDLGWSTSINSFSDPDYLQDNDGKTIRKINDNPGRIILNNPKINQGGKYRTFRWFSPAEYISKICWKMGSNPRHIPIGNMSGLSLLIPQVFQGIFW